MTTKTVGDRFLLRPSAALNGAILAIIGRALALEPVVLHAMAFLSNHWHGLLSVADALALSRFLQHVHSNVARAVNRLHDWDAKVFGKSSIIPVAPGAEEARLRYVLAQGAKEGLVRRSVDWPGVHCARALLGEEVLVGIWQDREHGRRISAGGGRTGGRRPADGELCIRYPIDLAPLPSWNNLDRAQQRQRVASLLFEIERDARIAHANVAGVDRIMSAHPHSRPTVSDKRRRHAPRIHAADEDERSAFEMGHWAFTSAFVEARTAIRLRQPTLLPSHCFPPLPPFADGQTPLWYAAAILAAPETAKRAALPTASGARTLSDATREQPDDDRSAQAQ